jgi:hypothetical protein
MFKRLGFRKLEIFILLITLLCFMAAIFAYFSGFSFQKYFLSSDDETQQPIGHLENKNGQIQREMNSTSGFNSIENETVLYNYDTILTKLNSTGVIKLNDGSTIELTPNTMLRLALEQHLDQDGLYRSYNVEVFSGQVVAKSKTNNFILKNKDKTVYIAKGENKEIVSKIQHPSYSIREKPVAPVVQLPPVAVAPIAPPQPVVEAPKPPVQVAQKVQPVKAPTQVARVQLPKKVIQPPINKVEQPKPAVVQALPAVVPNRDTLPLKLVELPLIKYPPNNSAYAQRAIASSADKRVLLTWTRKKHIIGFDVEIASDPDFKHVVVRQSVNSNFYSFANPKLGTYWWKVRAYSQNSQSGFTKKNVFYVK